MNAVAPGLMHWVSLTGPAGVELHFAEFVRAARERHPQWSQAWLSPGQSMHPELQANLGQSLNRTVMAKRWHGIKLPSKPEWIRCHHLRREFKRANAKLAIVWNRTARTKFVVDAIGAENCIHWEHGSAWHPGRERERRDYLHRVPVAITNSHASARVLQLLWQYPGAVRVCLNALRPSLVPSVTQAKIFPSSRPIRLGIAARLLPVKGIAVALNAMKNLIEQSFDAQLHIAGVGAEREQLESLAQNLGVGSSTCFHGAVDDMPAFYRGIDCLIHPALTEAFGLVAIEAAAHGCPVIAAAVDGLPEAVAHGVSGYCLRPTLSMTDYAHMGGGPSGVPEFVYDPEKDEMCPPRIIDPAELAAAVLRLFDQRESYESLSGAASSHVLHKFEFATHVDEVMAVVDGQASR